MALPSFVCLKKISKLSITFNVNQYRDESIPCEHVTYNGLGPELQCLLKVKEDLRKLSIDISTCYMYIKC